MDANTAAYWWSETVKAVAGPAGGVVVSIYVIRRQFEVMDRLFRLVESLALNDQGAPHASQAPVP